MRTRIEDDDLLEASVGRLGRDDYHVAAVMAETRHDSWPGDLAGRLLLSLARLARADHVPHDRLVAFFEAMTEATTDVGYFGPVLADIVDEQQVACHGWVTSGYLQYAAVTGDRRGVDAAMRVVDGLLLPAATRLGNYPTSRVASEAGAPSGTAAEVVNGWRVSTDTWCILLALNGLVPAWAHTGRQDIADVVERFIKVLETADLVGQRAQLHATLAAARNVAHYAELTGRLDARQSAARLYETYATHARTLTGAPYNWFGRPDTWTEPCAIVDSIGLALSLWRQTGDPDYVRDVLRTERNAMTFAQRIDGSFGLDSISTWQSPRMAALHMDARWCCTVRGALGLMELRDRSVEWDHGNLTVVLPRTGQVRGLDAAPGWNVALSLSSDEATLRAEVVSAPAGGTPITVRGPLLDGEAVLAPVAGATGVLRVSLRSEVTRVDGVGYVVIERDRLLVPTEQGPRSLADLRRGLEKGASFALVHDTATGSERP